MVCTKLFLSLASENLTTTYQPDERTKVLGAQILGSLWRHKINKGTGAVVGQSNSVFLWYFGYERCAVRTEANISFVLDWNIVSTANYRVCLDLVRDGIAEILGLGLQTVRTGSGRTPFFDPVRSCNLMSQKCPKEVLQYSIVQYSKDHFPW